MHSILRLDLITVLAFNLFCQKLLKVQVGSITYTGLITVHKIMIEKSFEIRAYIKGNVGLNISALHITGITTLAYKI